MILFYLYGTTGLAFTFEQPIKAEKARKFGNALLEKGAESVNLQNFHYYDKMIPAQDYLKNGGLGNLIALPLQPEALKDGNSAFVDDNWNAYFNQYEILFHKHRLTEHEIDQRIMEWSGINPFENKEIVKNTRNKPWENQLELRKEDVSGVFKIVVSNQLFIDTLKALEFKIKLEKWLHLEIQSFIKIKQ